MLGQEIVIINKGLPKIIKRRINMRIILISSFASFFVISSAYAIVFGGTNFNSFSGYPDHSCSAPYSKPVKPYSFDSQWELDSYNLEVETYNNQVGEYIDCINEYVANARNDIKRITEKANKSIESANIF